MCYRHIACAKPLRSDLIKAPLHIFDLIGTNRVWRQLLVWFKTVEGLVCSIEDQLLALLLAK